MHQAMGYRYGILIWKSSDDDNDDVSYIAHISQKSESPLHAFVCVIRNQLVKVPMVMSLSVHL